jgi:hypothetical protein
MTHLADLTPYTYHPETVPAGVICRAVGWLERGHPFPTGSAPEGFVERLGRLCRDERRAAMRGFHLCDLGGHPAPSADQDPDIPLPTRVDVDGTSVLLGSAEVRVVAADGTWLAAPSLVHHYVTDHGYLPPAPFVEAVLAGRVAPEIEG